MNCYILGDLTDFFIKKYTELCEQELENINQGLDRHIVKSAKQYISTYEKFCKLTSGRVDLICSRRNKDGHKLFQTINNIISKYGYDSIYDPNLDAPIKPCNCSIGLHDETLMMTLGNYNRRLTKEHLKTHVSGRFTTLYFPYEGPGNLILSDDFINFKTDGDILINLRHNKICSYLLPYGYFPYNTEFTKQDRETFRFFGFKLIKACQLKTYYPF